MSNGSNTGKSVAAGASTPEVLALGGSWHGVTGGAASVSFASDRRGYGPPLPGVHVIPEPGHVPSNVRRHVGGRFGAGGTGTRAETVRHAKPSAIIMEPVISAGGVIVPPRRFVQALRAAADERGMLLSFDEAQTAFGRIGESFGAVFHGVMPDVLTTSKTLRGGLPLAAVSTSSEIEEQAHRAGFTFYTSHVSDPLPAKVGLAVLDTIRREALIERARAMGDYLRQHLLELQLGASSLTQTGVNRVSS